MNPGSESDSSRRLADTALSVVFAFLLYPMTVVPTGDRSNGGVIGFSLVVIASFYAWRALILNDRSPWLRRLFQLPLAALVTFTAIHEAFVQCVMLR